MVNKCCAINCRSGCTGEDKDPDVTLHSFPQHDAAASRLALTYCKKRFYSNLVFKVVFTSFQT